MEKLDYKKEFKERYMPSAKPVAVNVPEMIFFAVRGCGDPNSCNDYKNALELLYAMSFTVKMSKMNGTQPEGYFEYVVPPLEGLWYQEGTEGIDYSRKEDFKWISMIRQPEFVTEEVFENARAAVQKKKPHLDVSKVQLMKWSEGLCVQLMHTGPYDDEPASIEKLKRFAEDNGYEEDFSEGRYHHEIYLSDPRKCAPERLKTVIRHPVKFMEN
ncbi:MAG: GyrI-like domain-containing protein [Huintestinicola sp.]